jgi:hypothetical protein
MAASMSGVLACRPGSAASGPACLPVPSRTFRGVRAVLARASRPGRPQLSTNADQQAAAPGSTQPGQPPARPPPARSAPRPAPAPAPAQPEPSRRPHLSSRTTRNPAADRAARLPPGMRGENRIFRRSARHSYCPGGRYPAQLKDQARNASAGKENRRRRGPAPWCGPIGCAHTWTAALRIQAGGGRTSGFRLVVVKGDAGRCGWRVARLVAGRGLLTSGRPPVVGVRRQLRAAGTADLRKDRSGPPEHTTRYR